MDALFALVISAIPLAILTAIGYVLGVYPFKMNHVCKVCGRQIFGWQHRETDPFNAYHVRCKIYADERDEVVALYENKVSQLKTELQSLKPVPGGEAIQYPSTITVTMKRKKNAKDNSGHRRTETKPAKRK